MPLALRYILGAMAVDSLIVLDFWCYLKRVEARAKKATAA